MTRHPKEEDSLAGALEAALGHDAKPTRDELLAFFDSLGRFTTAWLAHLEETGAVPVIEYGGQLRDSSLYRAAPHLCAEWGRLAMARTELPEKPAFGPRAREELLGGPGRCAWAARLSTDEVRGIFFQLGRYVGSCWFFRELDSTWPRTDASPERDVELRTGLRGLLRVGSMAA